MGKKIFTVICIFSSIVILTTQSSAQSNSQASKRIMGKVVNAETGEPVVGANIYLEGTTRGASANLEGEFVISGVQPGTYTIVISAVSYTKKRITQFTVNDAATYVLNIQLYPETIQGKEVVVEEKALLWYEGVLLKQRKNAATVSDAMSAEQMKRTPDATSADALRRLTGISLVDNKFVFVRGVTDRYNQALLNGTTLASVETDRRGFSFDIVPSNLLENVVVVKSATPEMRGDFTGGLVQLNTLDFPEQQTIKISVGTAYNTQTTFRPTLRSQTSAISWLGITEGSRKFPEGETDLLKVAQELPNTWDPHSRRAPLNTSLALTYGNVFPLADNNETQLGVVAALTYRNATQRSDRTLTDITIGRYSSGVRNEYSVLWGALANLSVRFSTPHKISFKNTYNYNAEDQVGVYSSHDLNTNLENHFTMLNWTQRALYNGQLHGEHYFSLFHGLMLDWKFYISNSLKEVPDRKEVTYYREYGSTDDFETAVNTRSWSKLNEKNIGGTIDCNSSFSFGKVKLGTLYEKRMTNYAIRYFNVVPDYFNGIPTEMVRASLETIYAPENFGRGKFLFEEVSKASDRYIGQQKLVAGYLMIDVPWEVSGEKLRMVGGVRLEQNTQYVDIPRSLVTNEVDRTQLQNVDVLPSVNLTYLLSESTNIRLAYARTVNRPEFREMAKTGFYDFIRYEIVGGNPNLRQSEADNYDVRLEIFPGAGELVALSVFHKEITDAIEEQLMFAATRTRTWFNSPRVKNTGWEFELRKDLGFLTPSLNQSTVNINYTRVFSEVRFTLVEGNSIETQVLPAKRPMQGQSPYVVNVSVLLVEPTFGTTMNILYNKFGKRLDAVGFLAADIYEEARETVDISLTQSMSNDLEVKLSARNITGSDKLYTRAGLLYERIKVGTTYSFQIAKSF